MNYLNLYVDFLDRHLKPRRPMKVVFDCSNGTTGIILKELFQASGVKGQGSGRIEAILINDRPDGNFPAHGPNPMAEGAMDELRREVVKNKADLGVVFDADGDRVFFVDNLGRSVRPDAAAALMIQEFSGPLVFNVSVGYLVREAAAAQKKEVLDSRVGHTFMKQMMKEKKANFGAEISGHYFFRFDGNKIWDSGILGAIHIINLVSGLGTTFSDWLDRQTRSYHSGELNFEVDDKEEVMRKIEAKYTPQAKTISKIDGVKMEFSAEGGQASWWFIVRPSNTENLLRLVLEAKDREVFEKELKNIQRLTT